MKKVLSIVLILSGITFAQVDTVKINQTLANIEMQVRENQNLIQKYENNIQASKASIYDLFVEINKLNYQYRTLLDEKKRVTK